MALGATLYFAQVGNPIVQPPPVQTTIRNEITVQAPPPDPQAIADASVQSSEAILTTIIAPPPMEWANELLGLPNVWTRTPDELTWNNGSIRELAKIVAAAALALLGLAIFAAAAGHTLGQGASYGRVIFALVMSVGNLLWWEVGIKLNNAIAAALGGPDLPAIIRPHLQTTIDPGSAAGTVVLFLVYAIVSLMLMFTMLFRLGLVDVLIAVGSLALLCYATEQSEHIASHYTRLAVGILFSQVLIVLGLRVASVISGLGNEGAISTLLGIVILILVRSLPQMMISGAGAGSRQGSGIGMAALMMIRRRIGL